MGFVGIKKKDPSSRQKIFCIGLSRTGTKSLSGALAAMGLKTAHWDYTRNILLYKQDDDTPLIDFKKFDHYDAFSDIPISRIYKELDKSYPEAKFILTVRDLDGWVVSIKRHLGNCVKKGNADQGGVCG